MWLLAFSQVLQGTTPIHQTHWLSLCFWSQFKVLVLTFKALGPTGLKYQLSVFIKQCSCGQEFRLCLYAFIYTRLEW